MTCDWFSRDDDDEPLPGRPGVSRLRKKLTTPDIPDIAPLAGAQPFVPIGPSAVLFGATTRRAPVGGRIRALAVSDDGARVYVATAGGLWYSGDAGTTWMPLDAAASTRALDGTLHDARALAVGALSVQFGAAANGANDVVFAGTGDPALESAIGPDGGRGIGIRTAVGPVPQVIAGNAPWALEAKNLAGAIVLALIRDRANDIWAATTDGLYKRPPGNRDDWDRVFRGIVWDLAVTIGVGAEPQRLWVASDGKLQWTSDGQNFQDVALPDDFPKIGANAPAIGRIRLAASTAANPPFVWALAGSGRLWRVDAAGASPVDYVPSELSGRITGDRSDMALAIGCARATPNDLIVAGSVTRTKTPEPAAAVYRATPARRNGRWTFFGANGTDTRMPPALAGIGVPSGVHAIAFAPGTQPAPHVWMGTDGGVFQSRDRGGAFISRNVGLPTFEIEQFADHARAEALVLAGAPTAGSLSAAGYESWLTAVRDGGGAVAIDPADGARVVVQRRGAWLLSTDGQSFAPVQWFNAPAGTAPHVVVAYDAANVAEEANSARASTPAAIVGGNGATQLAIATRRVWYSEDWGGTWRTLPTVEQDPSAVDAGGRGPHADQDLVDGELRVLRWGTTEQLYALTATHIYLYRRTPGANNAPPTWARTTLYDGPSLKPKKRKSRGNQIPPEMPLTNVFVHDAAVGQHGSLYATTARSFEDDDEHHVWWYDGAANWYDCGLDVPAPAYALTIDPAHPEHVFVGTAVGVYRGVYQAPANPGDPPTWMWTGVSAGLPEAPCLALSVHAGARVLRTAIWGHGLFEARLENLPAEPATVVFLRAHQFDWRRSAIAASPRGPFATAGRPRPLQPADYDPIRLDASPDVRVRRMPGEVPPALLTHPSGFVENRATPRTFDAFAIQAALRRSGDRIVPVTGSEDASFAPAVERRLRRDETNTAAGWNEATERGAVGNVYPLDARLAFEGAVAAAPAPTATTLTVAGVPFAGRDLRGLVLRVRHAAADLANRGATAIVTSHTDSALTFTQLPGIAAGDPFELEEKTPGTGAATTAMIDEVDPTGVSSCQTIALVRQAQAAGERDLGRTLVDVTVHARSRPVTANRVRVALLRGPFAGLNAAITPLPNNWVAQLRADINLPAANRGGWLPAGWSYFDTRTRDIPTLPRALDARNPVVVTFEGMLPAGHALLLAAVIAEDDLLNAATGDVLQLAREQRHVALRSVSAVAEPVVKHHAFFEWHARADPAQDPTNYITAVADDRRIVRRRNPAVATDPLIPKTRLHLCFREQAVASFELTLPAGNWQASWSIVDAQGRLVAQHPTFVAGFAAIAAGVHAWKWDGRFDPPNANVPRGRIVVQGVYRSRLRIRKGAPGALSREYMAEILAEGNPYHIFVDGVPKNDVEMTAMIGGADPYGPNDGQRIPRDCWILVYRGQRDQGHCVFLGQGIIEATDIDAGGANEGAVQTPHEREYKGYVRRDPGGQMNNADRCQIVDLGGGGNIALNNGAGAAPNNPYAPGGGSEKAGVQAHEGSNNWTGDGLSSGCTGVSPRSNLAANVRPSQLELVRSNTSDFGDWGQVNAENAQLASPDFFNKQTKRPGATDAAARTDALLPDDHARPVLDPPALAAGVEPLHLQATFQQAAFGGFIRGELPTEQAVPPDEPALDAAVAPQARMRCVLRDYRRGSSYHVYHHAVLVGHRRVAAGQNYDIDLWVPRKVIRGWNSPIPGDDHSVAARRANMADRRHHDPLPENRRNVRVTGRLQVRWYIRHTPPAGQSNRLAYLVGNAANPAALAAGHQTRTWNTGGALNPGLYESVCEYSLQVEPHAAAAHVWHPELAIPDPFSAGGRLEAETVRTGVGAQQLTFIDGVAVLEIVRV